MNEEPERPEVDEPAIIAERRAKLARLREAGVEPFPHEFEGRTEIAAVREAHDALESGEETDASYRVAGRIASRRDMGKAAFLDLVDGSGKIQLQSRADDLGDRHEDLVGLDLGDIVGVEGTAFKSRRGELTLRVTDWRLLAKSLRPPPDKFHGLEDVDTRYRHREQDLIANPEVRDRFLKRARVVAETRRWLDERGFVEVETPVLQPIYGGALARPFVTHHNALDRDLYLRIATELYLKRCIVGGIDRVYELGKDFRNEGISFKHNPEFTMLEWYEAYADYGRIADELEELVDTVARDVRYEGDIDFTRPWRRITLRDAIRDETGLDVMELRDRDALVASAKEKGIELDPTAVWAQLVDHLLSKHVEPKLANPTFVVDYPKELSPFAKDHRTEAGLVERFECFAGGMEFANAFSELNDPDEQRARFEQQQRHAAEGDEEAQPFDEDFIQALEYGMPPTGGIGVGVDRLVMLLAGKRSMREIVLFPTMR